MELTSTKKLPFLAVRLKKKKKKKATRFPFIYQHFPKKFQTSSVIKFATENMKHVATTSSLQNRNWLPAVKNV